MDLLGQIGRSARRVYGPSGVKWRTVELLGGKVYSSIRNGALRAGERLQDYSGHWKVHQHLASL